MNEDYALGSIALIGLISMGLVAGMAIKGHYTQAQLRELAHEIWDDRQYSNGDRF